MDEAASTMSHTLSYWKASDYATYRPHYPEALFRYLSDLVSGGESNHNNNEEKIAWDCGTGNGQVAKSLVPYFHRIIATDVNTSQISNAFQHPQIEYRIATAEQSNLENESIDLITVGSALHWFDLPLFFREAHRVLKPNTGLLAVWCYYLFTLPDADTSLINALQAFYELVDPYLPKQCMYVKHLYQTINIPSFFEEISSTATEFDMNQNWNCEQMIGFIMTWSASTLFVKDQGPERIDQALQAIRSAWGDPSIVKRMEWPLSVRVFRNKEA